MVSRHPHFLLIPLPEYGHSSPMLSLASHLAQLGCTVTFLAAEKAPLVAADATSPPHIDAHAGVGDGSSSGQKNSMGDADETRPMPSSASLLQFHTLPYTGEPSNLRQDSPRFEIFKETLAGLEERQGMVETMVQESKHSNAPIDCVVCDILLCSWVMPLAKRQGIPSATLLPCSFTTFYLPYLVHTQKSEAEERLRLSIGQPAQTMPSSMTEEQKGKFEDVKRVFWGAKKHLEQASYILANSCECLETEALAVLGATTELNVRFIGPCFPAQESGDGGKKAVSDGMAKKAGGSSFTADQSCLPWLDRQEKNSVLLVSFGSEVSPDAEQVEELAMGIEASGCKFLWVARPDAQRPPKDYLERMHGIGMCVQWSPQKAVLQHEALGGFLTHCGWNSTMESILFGVPMLCLPLNGDQFFNAHMVHSHWKVGLRLGPPNTLVPRARVEECVRELMSGDECRIRIRALQDQVHSAWLQSRDSISSFMRALPATRKRSS